MIKLAGTTTNGRKLVVLGITEMNVTRLREGKPIHIHAEDVNLPGVEIVITLGKDDATLNEQFAPLIGPETTVRDHRSKASRQ
jgi:hypothetical protein